MSRSITKTQAPDVEALRNTINTMDASSQQGINEATSVLSLMQHALDTAAGAAAVTRDLPTLLRMLEQRLNEAMFTLNETAEQVGANYVDEVNRRRAALLRSRDPRVLSAAEPGGTH